MCAFDGWTRRGFAGQIRRGAMLCFFAGARWVFCWLSPGFLKSKAVSPRLLCKLMGEMVFSSFARATSARSQSVSPGLLRKLFWRVTFAWRGKSHQNRADRTRLFRRNYTGTGLTETLNTPSLMLAPI